MNREIVKETSVKLIKKRIRARYNSLKQKQEEGSAHNKWKKFKGRCLLCGKIGHKQADCSGNPNNKKQLTKTQKTKNFVTSARKKVTQNCIFSSRKGKHMIPMKN